MEWYQRESGYGVVSTNHQTRQRERDGLPFKLGKTLFSETNTYSMCTIRGAADQRRSLEGPVHSNNGRIPEAQSHGGRIGAEYNFEPHLLFTP